MQGFGAFGFFVFCADDLNEKEEPKNRSDEVRCTRLGIIHNTIPLEVPQAIPDYRTVISTFS